MVVETCKRGFCELQKQLYSTLQLLYTDPPAGTKNGYSDISILTTLSD